jgi:hypothetical protein
VQSRIALSLAVASLFAALPAQQDKEQPKEKAAKPLPVDEARVAAAFADARAAVEKVLGSKLDDLPPPQLVGAREIARTVADENLPAIRRRQPDEELAKAEAERLGAATSTRVYAKYAWSTHTLLVVGRTWEQNARLLNRPQLTSDHALRSVLVHELCHAVDDRRFGFADRLAAAATTDAVDALNAVIEGHAQYDARRVCKESGWSDGFDEFTGAIGALPAAAAILGQGEAMILRATATAAATAYVDGERFVAAVLTARKDKGEQQLFEAPPKDLQAVLQPQWYLDPASRPDLLYDFEPALDAFAAAMDAAVWSGGRSSPTGKQIASGLTLLPQADVDTFVASLRAARLLRLVPTDAPQSKAALLCAIEFDSADSARRWIDLSMRVSDLKDKAMAKGMLRITGSKTTPLDSPSVCGVLQEKKMRNGAVAFDVASIDAMRGRIVVETIFSGEPPATEAHLALVEQVLDKVTRRK